MHTDFKPLSQLGLWHELSDDEKTELALAVGEHLGDEWKYDGLTENSLASQRHRTARFVYRPDSSFFRLIPGDDAALGFDGNSFVAGSDELESWNSSRVFSNLELNDHLDAVLTPLRIVEISPMLVAESATRIGREALDAPPDLPDFLLTNYSPDKPWYREHALTLADARSIADKMGFRLPTSDEWEYTCAGNSRTLFRWGTGWPRDCYPNEAPRGPEAFEEVIERFSKRRPMTDERRARLWDSFRWSRFDLHVQPNAFGLAIAQNPYHLEVCEDGELRGGDGGVATCSDLYGFFAAWLTLASSFLQCNLPSEGQEGLYFRRVRSLELNRRAS